MWRSRDASALCSSFVTRRVIFLDIDGVLAPIRRWDRYGDLDPACIRVLNEIVAGGGAGGGVGSTGGGGKNGAELPGGVGARGGARCGPWETATGLRRAARRGGK